MCVINRKIQHFSLLLAVLIIIAHMVIPHDHHLAGTIPGQDETCPYSKNNTGNHKGFPVHCHAFNDLNAEKATSFTLTAFPHLTIDPPDYCHSEYSALLEAVPCRISYGPGSLPALYYCTTGLLRAPPVFIGEII